MVGVCTTQYALVYENLFINSQVRIDPGNVRLLDSFGQRPQPALGFPLLRIWTPQLWVPIRCKDTNKDDRALRYRNLVDEGTIKPSNWLREGHDNILSNFAQ